MFPKRKIAPNGVQDATTMPKNDGYTYDVYPGRPLAEKDLFEQMIQRAAGTDYRVSGEQMRELVRRVEANYAPGDYLTINGKAVDGLIPMSTLSAKDPPGKKGYHIEVSTELRSQVAVAAQDLGLSPRADRTAAVEKNLASAETRRQGGNAAGADPASHEANWSSKYTERVEQARARTEALKSSFLAMDAFYQKKNERDGLGTYIHTYLKGAATDARTLDAALLASKSDNNTAENLEAANLKYGRKLDEVFPNKSPEEIKQFLYASYEAGFDNWNTYAEWIGSIPTPATRGIEFGMKTLANGLRLASHDIDAGDFALYATVDGAKGVLGNYAGRIEKLDGGATLKVMSDLFTDLTGKIADTQKNVKLHPELDANAEYRKALLETFVGAGTGLLDDKVKLLDKYGVGAEVTKTFGINLVKNFSTQLPETLKEVGDKPDAQSDATSRMMSRVLAKTFFDGVGKSLGTGATDDDAVWKAYAEVAKKAGVDTLSKEAINRMKEQDDARDKDKSPPSPKPLPANAAPSKTEGQSEPKAPATSLDNPLLNDPAHPKNALFQKLLGSMQEIDRSQSRPSDQGTTQAAGALTSASVRAGVDADRAVLGANAQNLFAVRGDPASPASQRVAVPTVQAFNQPLDVSTAQVNQALENKPALAAQDPAQDVSRRPSMG